MVQISAWDSWELSSFYMTSDCLKVILEETVACNLTLSVAPIVGQRIFVNTAAKITTFAIGGSIEGLTDRTRLMIESTVRSQLTYGDLVGFSRQEILRGGLPLPASTSQL